MNSIKDFHPGAQWCVRSFVNKDGAAQQCCYSKDGRLITDGAAAGTADKRAATSKWKALTGGHQGADVNPWFLCGGRKGLWKNYNSVRPPNKGHKDDGSPCDPNAVYKSGFPVLTFPAVLQPPEPAI